MWQMMRASRNAGPVSMRSRAECDDLRMKRNECSSNSQRSSPAHQQAFSFEELHKQQCVELVFMLRPCMDVKIPIKSLHQPCDFRCHEQAGVRWWTGHGSSKSALCSLHNEAATQIMQGKQINMTKCSQVQSRQKVPKGHAHLAPPLRIIAGIRGQRDSGQAICGC